MTDTREALDRIADECGPKDDRGFPFNLKGFDEATNYSEEDIRRILKKIKKEEPVKTERPLFKVGPAKTIHGNNAVIFEISDQIYGKTDETYSDESNPAWLPRVWDLKGRQYKYGHIQLVPNNLPERIEFEALIVTIHSQEKEHAALVDTRFTPFIGKRVKVVVTAIEDGE